MERIILTYFKFHKENYKNRLYFSPITYTDFYSIKETNIYPYSFFSKSSNSENIYLPTNAKLIYIYIYI